MNGDGESDVERQGTGKLHGHSWHIERLHDSDVYDGGHGRRRRNRMVRGVPGLVRSSIESPSWIQAEFG
jgi:hypothetical protein